MDFGNFLGNERVKSRLLTAVAQRKLSHSYLLCGPQGSGKHTLCQILEAAMECTDSKTVPCGHCNQCRKVAQGIHPDVIVVDDTTQKTVPVDVIRQARSDAFIRPNEGNRKIYVIPRAQDLGLPGQNALLKIIEEPPSYAAFLLLCENPDKLLPTIRSRCVELHLAPLPQEVLLQALQQRAPQRSLADLQAAAAACGGFLGQALQQLAGSENLLLQTEPFWQAFARSDALAMTQILISMEKMPREAFYDCMQQWIQLLEQAILVRSGRPCPNALSRSLAASRTTGDLLQAIEHVQKVALYSQANVGVGHLCGALAVSLRDLNL